MSAWSTGRMGCYPDRPEGPGAALVLGLGPGFFCGREAARGGAACSDSPPVILVVDPGHGHGDPVGSITVNPEGLP